MKSFRAACSESGRQDIVTKKNFEYLSGLNVHIKHRKTTSNAKFQIEKTSIPVLDHQVMVDTESKVSIDQPALSEGEDENISTSKGKSIEKLGQQ